jgi:hypothetical protein
MSNISPLQQQLRRIDQQLTENRQRIAVLNLENVELENARLTLLRLAEQDAIVAGRPGMAGLQIRVGPPAEVLHLADDGAASRAAKYGGRPKQFTEEELKAKARERDRKRYHRKQAAKKGVLDALVDHKNGAPDPVRNLNASPRGQGKHQLVARDVVKLLRKNGELLTGSLVTMLGKHDDRQSVSNALYQLKKEGVITQAGPQQPYKLVEPNGAAHHG